MSTSTTATASSKGRIGESSDLIIHIGEHGTAGGAEAAGHGNVELFGAGGGGGGNGNEEKLLKDTPYSGEYRAMSAQDLGAVLSKFASETARTPAPHYGDPGAFGLGGFALTTFALSVCNTAELPSGVTEVALPLAMWYGGFAQLFAGLWEVQTGFTFAATAYVSYGAFWLSYATYAKFVVPDYEAALAAGTISADDIHKATGLFLLSWTFFTLFMTIAAYKVNRAVFLIFALLLPTFVLLTAGAYADNSDATKAGGWIGILCAFSAWYVMASKVINAVWKKNVLPLGEVD